jgi:hypothetical protein
MATLQARAGSTVWRTNYLRSLKPLDWHVFKS